jgi:hypothetical protein
MTAKEIGRQLNISHNTVHMHWRLARLKLGSLTVVAATHDRTIPGGETGRAPPRQTNLERRRLSWFDQSMRLVAISMAFLTALMLTVLVTIAVIWLFGLELYEPYYGLFRQ